MTSACSTKMPAHKDTLSDTPLRLSAYQCLKMTTHTHTQDNLFTLENHLCSDPGRQ